MKVIATVLLLILVTGCSTTNSYNAAPVVTSFDLDRVNQDCAQQVFSRVSNDDAGIGAFLATAENAEACIKDIHFNIDHPDHQLAMKLKAIAVNSYFKAGDISSADAAFNDFRTMFPMQDLVYDDFTSFVDTTTALLQYRQLTSLQLERLNINPVLKNELVRQQRWILQ